MPNRCWGSSCSSAPRAGSSQPRTHVLFTEVSEIQDRVYALREAGRNLRRGAGGILRVSALPSLALDALPTAVSRFLRTHADVKFDLQTVHHDDLLRKLYEPETDVAIAYEVLPGEYSRERSFHFFHRGSTEACESRG